MRYALKVKANIDNPTCQSIYRLKYSHLYEHVNRNLLPLGEFIKGHLHNAGISPGKLAQSVIPDHPVWQAEDIDVCFKLAEYDKKSTSPSLFKAFFFNRSVATV